MTWFDPLTADPSLLSLPPQSMANVVPAVTSKTEDKNEPEFVPSDQLKQFLLGKFDEPNIPSGVPNEQQQRQAQIHRDIGNATADTVSNLQNAIGILKPGAGNPNMGESSRRYGEQLAQRALGDAAAKRQEAIQNLQLSDVSDQRRLNQIQMAQKLMQDRMMRDPNSELSRQAQARELARLDALKTGTQDPAKIAILEQRKKMVAGVPASMLAGAEQNDPIIKAIELESSERTAGKKTDRESTNDAQRAAIERDRLREEIRHNMAEEKGKEESKNKLQLNEDKKAEDDIANLRNAKAELDRHISNLQSGKVSNDKPAVYGNEVSKFASSLGVPAQPNAALQDMLTSIPLAQATAEKAVTGSSRYTPQRWTQFAVQPGEGTKNSINKLKGGSRYLDELIQERMSQLHTDKSGEPTSQSAMAKAFPPGAIPRTAQRVQEHTNTGLPPAAGEIRNIKGGGKAQKQPDGSWKRIE